MTKRTLLRIIAVMMAFANVLGGPNMDRAEEEAGQKFLATEFTQKEAN
jgi:hypothetical protein